MSDESISYHTIGGFIRRNYVREFCPDALCPITNDNNLRTYATLRCVTFNSSRDLTRRDVTLHDVRLRDVALNLHHFTSRHATSLRHVTPRHVMPSDATRRHVAQRHVTARRVMSRHIISRHVTSHYVILSKGLYKLHNALMSIV